MTCVCMYCFLLEIWNELNLKSIYETHVLLGAKPRIKNTGFYSNIIKRNLTPPPLPHTLPSPSDLPPSEPPFLLFNETVNYHAFYFLTDHFNSFKQLNIFPQNRCEIGVGGRRKETFCMWKWKLKGKVLEEKMDIGKNYPELVISVWRSN